MLYTCMDNYSLLVVILHYMCRHVTEFLGWQVCLPRKWNGMMSWIRVFKLDSTLLIHRNLKEPHLVIGVGWSVKDADGHISWDGKVGWWYTTTNTFVPTKTPVLQIVVKYVIHILYISWSNKKHLIARQVRVMWLSITSRVFCNVGSSTLRVFLSRMDCDSEDSGTNENMIPTMLVMLDFLTWIKLCTIVHY